jgi:hypothetical protein
MAENIGKDESGKKETKQRLILKLSILVMISIQRADCRVPRDQFEGTLGEFFAGRNLVPWRRP